MIDPPQQGLPQDAPQPGEAEPEAEEEKLDDYKIEKDTLRLGILLEGPYGTGYLWHHLRCAARQKMDEVKEAYAASAWEDGVEVPPIEELEVLREKAAAAKKEKKEIPHIERAKSARSKCKHCDEPIAKDSWRVILGRGVEFGGQTRVGPINVHPSCVAEAMQAEDCATEVDGFEEALQEHSTDVSAADIEEVLTAIGELH